MIKFRQKDFSNYIVRDAIKGASLGAGLGITTAGLGFAPEKLKSWVPGHKVYDDLRPERSPYKVYNKDGKDLGWKRIEGQPARDKKVGDLVLGDTPPGATQGQKYLFVAATTVLGAALGAIVGAIRTAKDAARSTNNRLLKQVLPRLKSMGLVEGKDYTMDPKKANEIPTKVCIVLSSASGELQTVINSKDDRQLKQVVDKIVRMSPGRTQVSTQNNRFNEITITTAKNTAANVNQVISIIKSFVENGYPVYIVEVG